MSGEVNFWFGVILYIFFFAFSKAPRGNRGLIINRPLVLCQGVFKSQFTYLFSELDLLFVILPEIKDL